MNQPATSPPGWHRLDPERMSLLLQSAGWQVVGRRQGAYVRVAPPGDYRFSVLLPLDRAAPEFDQTMREALVDIEQLSTREIWMSTIAARFATEPADGFRFVAESAAPRGFISWTHGERLIRSARLFLSAGAKTHMERLSYYGSRFGQFANRYLDSVLMGQTMPGSYVVTAFPPSSGFVPLTTASHESVLFDASQDTAFASTRAISISAWIAASATVEAVAHYRQSGSMSAFEEMIPRGVSYEMAKALGGMVEGSDGAEINVEWDSEMTQPPDLPVESIQIRPADLEVLRRASNELLAMVAAPEHVTITGRVHLLTRKDSGGPGVIGVENLSRGKPKKVRVHLTDEEYHRALQAHDEDRAIVIEGTIEREGNINWIYEGHLLEVLPPVEEVLGSHRNSISGQLEIGEVSDED